MDSLSNPWVVGIGGGVLSGLLVAFVTRWSFSRRDRREHAAQISTANKEVLYAVRPAISEGAIPSRELLEMLIQATARKYGVDTAAMYCPAEVAQDLVKEVMDSSFISSKTKVDYSAQLTPLQQEARPREGRVTSHQPMRYTAQMPMMMAGLLGIMTMFMTLYVVLMGDKRVAPTAASFGREPFVSIALTTVVALSSLALAMMWSALTRTRRARYRLHSDQDQGPDGPGTPQSDGGGGPPYSR